MGNMKRLDGGIQRACKEEIYVNFMEERCRILNEKLEGNGDLDDVYKEFCGAIFSELEKTVIKGGKKRKQRLRKSKAWFGRKLWRMRKEFHATERKWLRGRVWRGECTFIREIDLKVIGILKG